MLHAWFSETQRKTQQRRSNGRILYETPEGERVEVTQVTKNKEHNCSGKVAEDISYLGLVKDSCLEGLKEKFSESG
jgi:hypothetical protein